MADSFPVPDPPPERAIKVVHITGIAGTFRAFLLNLLLDIKRAGFDLQAVCSPGEAIPEFDEAGIRVQRIPFARRMAPLQDLVSLWQLIRFLRREKVDIVHAHTPKAGLLARVAARLAGVPIIVFTVHGFYFHDDMPWLLRRCHILLEKFGTWCCDRSLLVSSEDVRTAVAAKIAPPDKIRYLGGGIDINVFRPDRLTPAEISRRRAEFGFPPDAVVVGIVARMVREKGYLELFEALSRLMAKFPNLYFLQVGGPDLAKPDALSPDCAKPFGIMERSRFLGDRRDVPDLLLLMDIIVLPSYREGLPVSLMEASASGVPVVTSRIRGCREVVVDGESGLLAKSRDSAGLANALEKLIASPQLRTQMGAAGRRRAVQHYDQRRVCRVVLENYRDLLRRRNFQEPAGLQSQLDRLDEAIGPQQQTRLVPRTNLKIGYVLRSLEDSGVTVYVLRLAEAMRRRGHDVFLVSDGGLYAAEVERLGLRRHELPFRRNLLTSYLASRRLADIVRLEQPDILHANWRWAQVACNLARIATGVPFVSTLHRVGIPSNWLYRIMTYWGSRVIAPCTEAIGYLQTVFHVPRENIRLIHHGLDPVDWPVPSSQDRADARKTFHLPPEAAVLVCIARMEKVKGHDVLLQALALARQTQPNLLLLLVGTGPEEEQLRALAAELGLHGSVQFLGYADPHEALAAADVFVLPSWQESFGLAPVEAMLSGRAIIRTDSSGAGDQIVPGLTGEIVPLGDAATMAAVLADVARNPARWQERGRKAHERAIQLFTSEAMADRVTALYEEVLAETAVPQNAPAGERR